MVNPPLNRRKFVKLAGASAIVAPTALAVGMSNAAEEAAEAAEAEVQKLSVDDPTAVALGYIENSSAVDGEKYPTHEPEQLCNGCALYIGEDPDWGGCSAFPGKQVSGNGWCTAYVAKA